MNKKDSYRQITIQNLLLIIVVLLVLSFTLISLYITKNNYHYLTYTENSQVDYQVLLKENEFFKEKYMTKNKSYISSIIEDIEVNFKYNLSFNEPTNYKYSYRISAEIDVEDDQQENNLYHFQEDLLTKELQSNSNDLYINKDVTIKYEDYNNLVKKFKSAYDLKNIISNLYINLYVDIKDINNNQSLEERKITSLIIPLALNTINIDIGNSIINNQENKIEMPNPVNYCLFLIIGLLFLVLAGVYIVYLIIFIRKTRTAQMIYDKEIKSILNNYDSYIQKINGSYDIGTSQVLKIESFNDMLEIRDTLKQPILMLESEAKDGSFFIIPATNSIIYTYALRVVDIKAKMDGKEIPTYDITEIPKEIFKKNKKYTDKYIQEQITMTTAMPTVDTKNIIKGNKDKEKDLYNQLEMTRSFDINEIKKAEKELKKQRKKKKTKKSV